MRLYRAENLKFRHTVTGKLWILMQALTLLLAYGISRGNGISSAYNWWYTLMLPGMVTLSACIIGEKDRKGKNRAVLSLPSSPGKVWDAKILVGMKTLLLANLLGAAANLILDLYLIPRFWIPQVLEISPAQIAASGAVMTAATLWQIPLCLWMSQKWGFLPALILNMILNGSGPLAAVTPYWILDPWARNLSSIVLISSARTKFCFSTNSTASAYCPQISASPRTPVGGVSIMIKSADSLHFLRNSRVNSFCTISVEEE